MYSNNYDFPHFFFINSKYIKAFLSKLKNLRTVCLCVCLFVVTDTNVYFPVCLFVCSRRYKCIFSLEDRIYQFIFYICILSFGKLSRHTHIRLSHYKKLYLI